MNYETYAPEGQVKDELHDLERRLALRAAKSTLQRGMRRGGGDWAIHFPLIDGPLVQDAIRYLELRGLLERKPDAPHLVRVKGGRHMSHHANIEGEL